MTYMRIDQIMLATMLDDHAVGVFSAALRVAEVWYFIPMAITGAAFPRMLEKRTADPTTYQRYTQGLYDGLAWLGLAVRSEERRVGTEWVSTCRFRGSPEL